ncbi:GAF and ANTAR domain-containing protein [Sinomonas halotolerans]|uniref:GAF and ANTAR domain-containing protein n=1 Tax=Sinomonas halotolerans TaxID=1644133 RepID=A0ABU9WZE7_9MICC
MVSMTGMTGAESSEHLELLLESADLASFLQRLAEIACRDLSVAGEVHCSVTVTREPSRTTVATSDAVAAAMDELQYSSGEGPCQESAETAQTVYVPDIATEPRYPRYRRAMASTPVRSVFATPIPLPPEKSISAALNCYSTAADAFPPREQARAEGLAALTSRAILLAVQFADERDRVKDLEAALESRTAIDLACGIIMAQTSCSQARAMEILKTASMNRNIKVRDIALQMIARFDENEPVTNFR